MEDKKVTVTKVKRLTTRYILWSTGSPATTFLQSLQHFWTLITSCCHQDSVQIYCFLILFSHVKWEQLSSVYAGIFVMNFPSLSQ